MTCNTNKRDTDDTDFRGVLDSYSDREAGCIFCEIGARRIIAENKLCFAINDAFPVTQHHTLVIPKRHFSDYLDTAPKICCLTSQKIQPYIKFNHT